MPCGGRDQLPPLAALQHGRHQVDAVPHASAHDSPRIAPHLCRLLAVDGGVLSFAELMFHTRNAPRMPGRSDAAAMQDAAWQAAYERRGWAVTSLDPSAAVIDHVPLITSPPDGHYSLLGAPAAVPPKQRQQQQRQLHGDEGGSGGEGDAEQQEQQGWVRALVFPLDPTAAGQAPEQLEVQLSGWLPNGVQLFSKPMQLQQLVGDGSSGSNGNSDGGLLFVAQGETTVSCVGAAGDPAAHCHAPADVVSLQVCAGGNRVEQRVILAGCGFVTENVCLASRLVALCRQECVLAAPGVSSKDASSSWGGVLTAGCCPLYALQISV